MRQRKQHGRYFVGDKACPSAGAAITYAQNLAVNWPDNEERSFYVRDALNNALYRVDKEANGVVLTHTL